MLLAFFFSSSTYVFILVYTIMKNVKVLTLS